MNKVYMVYGQDMEDEMGKVQVLGVYDNEAMAEAREKEMCNRFDSVWIFEGVLNAAIES
jgi:hypothetical protein